MNICGPVVAPETFPDSVPDYSDAAIVQVEEDKNAAYIAGTVSGAKLYSRHGTEKWRKKGKCIFLGEGAHGFA